MISTADERRYTQMRWDYLVQFSEFPQSGQTKAPRKLLQLKDRHPEIGSRPVGTDLIEAGCICVNLRSSAVGFSLRSLCSFGLIRFARSYETVFS
jgi:hypothetical protein